MKRSNPLHRQPLALACLSLLATACGGGSDLTAQERDELLAAPVTIISHGPNVVSRWHEVAGVRSWRCRRPRAGATPEERSGGPGLATVQLAVYDAVVAIAGGYKPYASGRPRRRPARRWTRRPTRRRTACCWRCSRVARRCTRACTTARWRRSLTATPRPAASRSAPKWRRAWWRCAPTTAGRCLCRPTCRVPRRGVPWRQPGQPARALIKPFALTSLSQFRPSGPPALDSAQYAADFDEVKAGGGAVSALRTAEQTEIARFHTAPPPSNVPTNLQQFATSNASLADNARIMAALWTATQDAGNACFEAKYHFNFWRPQSAIPLAADDGNAATAADAGWTPVVPTPNHPEYPSAHGCFSGSTSEVLRQFYGTKKIRFSFSSSVTGTTRPYDTTTDFIKEVVNARVWGGMHFRTANVHGIELGTSVAKWVMKNHFGPVN